MTAVGGFFFDSEPFRTASGVSSRSYWCKFEHGAGARPPELGAPRRKVGDTSTPSSRFRTPRAASHGAVGVPRTGAVGVCGVQRSDAVERSERQHLRHRGDACGVTPRLSGWQAAMGASCFASGEALDRGVVGIASWPRRDVLQAPLRNCGHRCGSVYSIALTAAHGSSVVSERQMLRNIFVSLDSG